MVAVRKGLMAKWLRVTVRVRVRARVRVKARARECITSFILSSGLTKCDEHLCLGSRLSQVKDQYLVW